MVDIKPEHFVSICCQLAQNPESTQRELSASTGLSLGLVNNVIKDCVSSGYLARSESRKLVLTNEGQSYLDLFKVKNAVILSAGFGSRCVPLTYETPKGLLEVHGKPMIELQIEQLLEKGITEIIIVVGYKKEQFDYLTDQYGVKLIYNPEFAVKNNLASLYCAMQWLDSTYVLLSDYIIDENMFNAYEARSWYSCVYFGGKTHEWCVRASPDNRIRSITIAGEDSLALVGPAYCSPSFSAVLKQYLVEYYNRPGTEDYYWEQILIEHLDTLPIYINKQSGNVIEIENVEELRLYDPSFSRASHNKVLETVSSVFGVAEDSIRDIQPLSKGMTNRSFTFVHDDIKYIMRVPGEGTDMLLDRKKEYATYQAISSLGICDDVVHFDAETGYKISKYREDARVCNPAQWQDVCACMKRLKEFHGMRASVEHSFDLFEQIEFYEGLWLNPVSCFRDYEATKANVMGLKEYIDSIGKDRVLTHIDAVSDNFLIFTEEGEEHIRLIDWEYAAMQDPHVDIAMFAIYALYDKTQIDDLIDCYFEGECPDGTREKIYAYVSICGLLWSNWCEYKSHLGVEFGEYAMRQYRYAKDYYRIFRQTQGTGSREQGTGSYEL